jgi:nicotinamidase-related amidase
MLSGMTETLERVASAAKSAREKGITVAHCRIAFNSEESTNLPSTNMMLARLEQNPKYLAAMHVDSPETAFDDKVAQEEGDIVFRKTRTGPFQGPDDFQGMLKERGIDTIIIAGVSTSGAVLSTVVQAADLDYRLFVLEDCCRDMNEELHRVLMEKFFPKRGEVINSSDLVNLSDS